MSQVWDQVFVQIRHQAWGQVLDQVYNQVREETNENS